MNRKPAKNDGSGPRAETRDERLKAALRANLQRRKAQARARDAQADDAAGPAEQES